MFEQEIATNITKTTNDVIGNRRSIGLSELLHTEHMPQRYKPFFENEVKYWLYQEALENTSNKRFDYASSEISSLVKYLDKLKLKHSFFEHDEFTKILDTAVKITFNYLCRPQTTLKWFIFRGEPIKPIQEVLLRLEPFSDYEYFREVFNEWVAREKRERPAFENISSQEFERIIRRIDDQILVDCSADDLLDIMKPMFEFIGKSKRQLPISAAVLFFDDKNIQKISIPLEQMYNKGKETISRRELIELIIKIIDEHNEPEADFSEVFANPKLNDAVKTHIESKLNTYEEEEMLLRELKLQSYKQGIVMEETRFGFSEENQQNVLSQNKIADSDTVTNQLDKSVKINDDNDSEENHSEENHSEENHSGENHSDKNDNLKDSLVKNIISNSNSELNSKQELNKVSTQSIRKTSDETALSQKIKFAKNKTVVRELDETVSKKILTMIFKNNEQEYDNFIISLRESETFDEALSKIDLICLKHSIDPNSFIPLRLSRAVYSWYK